MLIIVSNHYILIWSCQKVLFVNWWRGICLILSDAMRNFIGRHALLVVSRTCQKMATSFLISILQYSGMQAGTYMEKVLIANNTLISGDYIEQTIGNRLELQFVLITIGISLYSNLWGLVSDWICHKWHWYCNAANNKLWHITVCSAQLHMVCSGGQMENMAWHYRWTWIWRTQWDQENWSVICKIRHMHMTNTWYASDWDQAYRPSYAKIRRTVVRHIQVHLYRSIHAIIWRKYEYYLNKYTVSLKLILLKGIWFIVLYPPKCSHDLPPLAGLYTRKPFKSPGGYSRATGSI